jgi:hypothetical protein
MSGGPDRIALIPSDGWSWTTWPIHHQDDAIEYIRRDPAVLADLPEGKALIAAERERCAKVDWSTGQDVADDAPSYLTDWQRGFVAGQAAMTAAIRKGGDG